jgi:hypothetical protein
MNLEGRVIPLKPGDLSKGKTIHDVVLYIDGVEVAKYDGMLTKTTLKLSGFASTDEDETVHYCMNDYMTIKGLNRKSSIGIKLTTYIWEVGK